MTQEVECSGNERLKVGPVSSRPRQTFMLKDDSLVLSWYDCVIFSETSIVRIQPSRIHTEN